MQVITSKENEYVKHVRKLKDKKYRDEHHEFIVEGVKLVEEAIQEGMDIHKIMICEDCVENGAIEQKTMYEIAKYPCMYVTEKVFKHMTDVTNPQGMLAIIHKEDTEEEIDYAQEVMLLLDGIQDPGNLGTMIRSADSCGMNQIIVSKDTADPYNPKVVRSTMGAIYRVKIIRVQDLTKTIKMLQKKGIKVLGTSLKAEKSIYTIDYKKKAYVIGNEANGVKPETLEACSELVKIPMLGKAESLNAAVAASVILYEEVRKKLEENKK